MLALSDTVAYPCTRRAASPIRPQGYGKQRIGWSRSLVAPPVGAWIETWTRATRPSTGSRPGRR